ncbi:ribbon-helix-helix protein, CopG family, partial [Corynebacterium macclintockiae]
MNGALINLHIDDEQKRRLDRLSKRTGRSSSF